MSNSYRKTPIVGNTTAKSDRPSKRHSHKATRRRVRQTLSVDPTAIPLPVQEEICPAYGEKDGKHWVGHIVDDQPELLRK